MTAHPRHAGFLLGLFLSALVVPGIALAQGGGDSEDMDYVDTAGYYESDLMEDEGEMIDWVDVPKDMGDGVISTRDMVALAEFTIWMFDRLLESQDPTLAMPADAASRAVDYWVYMWPAMDDESKALISNMDLIFPAARENWASSTYAQRQAIGEEVLSLVVAIWGDQTGPAASYFANEISYEDFVPGMDRILAGFPNYNEEGEYVDDSSDSGYANSGTGEYSIHDLVSTHLGNFIEYN